MRAKTIIMPLKSRINTLNHNTCESTSWLLEKTWYGINDAMDVINV